MITAEKSPRSINRYFYDELERLVSGIIPADASVCRIGAGAPPAQGRFDYLVITSLDRIHDIQELFESLKPLCHHRTKLVLLNFSFLWEPIFNLAERLGLRRSQPRQNRIPTHHIVNLLRLTNFQEVKWSSHLLLPVYIPLLSNLVNRLLAPHSPFRYLASTDVIVARLLIKADRPVCCSVVVPCKDEKRNIEPLLRRMPRLADETEIVLVDDRSTDGTREEMERCAKLYPYQEIKIIEGPGICKAEAVRAGCHAATGEILAILDADLAVPPEELPQCIRPLLDGTADFVNTIRFVYPQQDGAMRWLNVLGNRAFALIFTILLRQRINDTLSGTKVFWKKDYENISRLKEFWIWRDQWGDFEQLLGASKLGLKIADIPVHYAERTHGETKMKNRFKNGLHMLKLCLGGLIRLRFG